MKPLASPAIAKIAPYEPGKPLEELHRELGAEWPAEGAIKLASNENPHGPSPKAVQAAQNALQSAHLYPDGGSFYLRDALAREYQVTREELIIGSGSNEIIDLLVQAVCEPDEEVLAPATSFACYRLSAEAHRRPFRETPNGANFAYDLDALAAGVTAKTKLVFLANPNNPTGAYAARGPFEKLVAALPPDVVFVVDEAYLEYVRAADFPNGLEYVRKRDRTIVLRTFSKIYGLAGLRVGYGIGSAELIGYLNRVRLAFNVNAVAQAAARAALEDRAHVERSQRFNAEELPRLADGLSKLGLAVAPSQANFLLVGFGGRDCKAIYQALLRRGVIVRPMGGYGLPGHLRITVGTASENERLLKALGDLL